MWSDQAQFNAFISEFYIVEGSDWNLRNRKIMSAGTSVNAVLLPFTVQVPESAIFWRRVSSVAYATAPSRPLSTAGTSICPEIVVSVAGSEDPPPPPPPPHPTNEQITIREMRIRRELFIKYFLISSLKFARRVPELPGAVLLTRMEGHLSTSGLLAYYIPLMIRRQIEFITSNGIINPCFCMFPNMSPVSADYVSIQYYAEHQNR
jgi:hypothetical protein